MKIINVVGKGPSAEHIKELRYPTISVNEVYGVVAPRLAAGVPHYNMRLDHNVLNCYPIPEDMIFVCGKHARGTGTNGVIKFTPVTPPVAFLSSVFAVHFAAQQLEADHIFFWGIDSAIKDHSYSPSIVESTGRKPSDFSMHYHFLTKTCERLKLTWHFIFPPVYVKTARSSLYQLVQDSMK